MSNQETGLFSCRNTCWIIGALLGVAVYLVLGCGIVALIVGAIVVVGAAFLLQKLFCGEVAEVGASAPAPATPAPTTPASVTESAAPAEAAAGEPSVAASAMDSAALTADTADVVTTSEEAEPVAAAPEEAPEPVAKKAKADTAKTEAAAPTGTPKKPRTMKAPRKAGADDLKQLKGVGPKLEQTLNDLGFWHFDQVAKWGEDEILWVDDNLKFKGRIERDGWVDQAKILAEGGETAFSNKVKKGKVY